MKRNLLLLFIAFLGFSVNVFAQPVKVTQTVSLGSSHTYSVDAVAGVDYTWASTGGTTTVLVAKSDSQTIEWTVAGVWDLTVFGTDANGCITETNTIKVTVAAEASFIFATGDANKSIVSCSPLFGGALTDTDFKVDFTGGLPPYILKYSVKDENGATTLKELTVGVVGDVSPLSGTITLSDFENTTTADQVVTVTLLSAKTFDKVDVKLGLDLVRTITIHAVPTISTITLN